MEEEEEKYQEFRESVAEMKDELRMETEQERSRLKRIFITTSVLLFYVSGVATIFYFVHLLLNYHKELHIVTADLIYIGSTTLIVSGTLIVGITLLAILFMAAKLICKYKNSDKSLMLAFNAIVFFALAGSATIIAVLSSQVVSEAEDNGGNAIQRYRLDTDASDYSYEANSAVDFLETNLVCCGFNDASDWLLLNIDAVTNGSPPPSCPPCDLIDPDDCVPFTHENGMDEMSISFNTTRLGCTAALEKKVVVLKIVTIALAAIFGAAMVFLVLFLVWSVIRKRSED